ncbi:MAG: Rossmann-like and DUF2520 domain-containing protein [Bacillota bacterium]
MNRISGQRIGFIGAGKVGVTLGAYLKAGGLPVAGYLSKSAGSARDAARITSTDCFTDIGALVKACGIIFITTPDGQIGWVWDRLARFDIDNRIICHTSGALSSEVFSGATEHGAYAYSVHPMFAFSLKDGSTAGLENAYFTIEGDGERLSEVCGLFAKTGNKTLLINPEDKTLYHLANVTVSNLALALLSLGFDCFAGCGIGMESAMEAAAPLIYGNIGNIMHKGFSESLTGPVERNDTGTVQKHADVLPEAMQGVYPLLSMRLIEIAQGKHPGRDYAKLREILLNMNQAKD